MRPSPARLALVAATVPAVACSLLSTENLQGGTGETTASVASSSTSTGAPGSTTNGSGGDGEGGDASGGGGPASGATGSSSTGPATGGAGGGGGPGPDGPCGEPSTYADRVLALEPLAYFRMGPDAASLPLDGSGQGHHASARGLVESVASPLGALGGCAMHARTLKDAPALLSWTPPEPTLFGDAGVYSLETWFVIDALPEPGDARFLFAREYESGARFHLYVTGGGALYWFFDLGGFRQVGYDDANIVPGELHHVVAIRTGPPGNSVDDDIYFYFDGRRRAGASGSGDDPLDGADDAPLTMPGEAGYGAPADGTFDEIAIYGRALTQDEVRSHFCAIASDVDVCP